MKYPVYWTRLAAAKGTKIERQRDQDSLFLLACVQYLYKLRRKSQEMKEGIRLQGETK